MSIVWAALFADVAAAEFDRAAEFWCGVTGGRLGEASGDGGEFVPLVRPDEDPHVWLQRTQREPGRAGWHPDFQVDDYAAAVTRARSLGASVTHESADVTAMTTPAGQPFCLFRGNRSRRAPQPVSWPAGHRSLVDQVCFDIPAADLAGEVAFWAALTGWLHKRSADYGEFQRLLRPAEVPIQILLQRLDGDDPIRAHADLSCSDAPAEVARHQGLGATVVRETEGWTTLRDPVGLLYCVTRRVPGARATEN